MPFDLKASISSLDGQIIQQCIENIRRADLKKVSIDDLKQELRDVIEAFAMFPVEIEEGKSIFRAVKHNVDEKGQYITDLKRLYPDPARIKAFSRANRVGQAIYYLSVDEGVALNEIKAGVGDVCTILECRARENLSPSLMPVRIHEMARDYGARIGGNFPDPDLRISELLGNDAESIRKHKMIENFIIDEFLKVVDETEDHQYKSTVAIAELLLSFGTDERPIDGIAYPSIACKGINANLAVLPDAFHRIYEPIACKVIRIEGTTLDQGFSYQDKNALRIGEGKIEWPNH